MTVDEYAEVSINGEMAFLEEGRYHNRVGRAGYWASYRNLYLYLRFSVSGTETPLALDEVAFAIRAEDRIVQREYNYFNRKGTQGFEATVLSGGHAFMLNATPASFVHGSNTSE